MDKEKYIGSSKLLKKPDKSIKMVLKPIGWEKLSHSLQNMILSINAGSTVPLSSDFGESENLAVTQKKITEAYNELLSLIQEGNTSTHNILPFDGFVTILNRNAISNQKYTSSSQVVTAEYTIVAERTINAAEKFYLKVEDTYYTNWEITTEIPITPVVGGDPLTTPEPGVVSKSEWYYTEYRVNKLFYNRSNKVVYCYNYATSSLTPITNIQVVEENAPEAESDSNPNHATKGSIVVDLEHDKLLTWNGQKWKALSGGSASEDVPNHLDVRNGILYLERVENGETTQLSHVILPRGGDDDVTTYDLVELNKNLGDNALSDIAVSNDHKLVLRDRTTADGGKNVVTLRENLVTGKRHTCTVVVKKGMPNPVTDTATETPENNIVRITINGTTYEVTLSHIAEIANAITSPSIPGVTTAEAKAAVNNSYPAAKYVAKHIAANFLSNIYNFTTKKIRVPYDSKYVSENGTEKVIFTKCALIGTQDSIPAASSITIKYHGGNSFAEDSELFSISDNVSENISLNVLTQEMITPANTDRTNTVFKVQINYDLQGQEIDIPEGCILQMDGGSITNGYLRGNNTVCTDFTAIEAELIGTWRNNDGEIVDNGLRRVRKTDATLGAYFYIGSHPGVSGCKKVELYRYLKKVGMGDVNMLEVKKARGNQFHINGTGGRYYLEYQYGTAINPPIEVNGRPIYTVSPFTVKENGVDVTKYKATIVTNEDYKEGTIYVQKPAFLGLEGVLTIEEDGQQKTIFDGSNPDPLIPDTVVDGQVVWGNADLVGLGLFLRLGIDTLSFLKFQGGTCGTDAAYTTYNQVTHLEDDPVPPEPSNYMGGEDNLDYQLALTAYNNKVNAVAAGNVHLFQRDADGTEMVNRINNIKNYELKYIKRLKDIGFKFDTVYVMNEAPITCNKGGYGELSGSSQRRATILNAFVNDLINPIKAEGYKVGVTFSMLQSYTRCLPEFYNALDEMGLNFYQPISFDDEHFSDEDDFTEDMKVAMQNALRGDINKKPKKRLCITEGGAGNWKNVLRETAGQRYDTYVNQGGNPSLDLDHSTPGHIYFKSMLKAAAALDVKRINLWFTINLETSHVEDTIIDCFYK